MVKTQFVRQKAPVQGFQKAFFPSYLGKNRICHICICGHTEKEQTPNCDACKCNETHQKLIITYTSYS